MAEPRHAASAEIEIPAGMRWWHGAPGGAEWLARLPRLAAECAEKWSLRLEPPFEPGHISLVLPAQRADGTDAVLKLNFPEPDSEHEADALVHWNGEGAVRLLEHDTERRALLVERCIPGHELWRVEDDERGTRIAASVLVRLWRPPPAETRFRSLESEAARWAGDLVGNWDALGRPFERAILQAAIGFLRELGPSQGPPVVAHQDFHGGNVLSAQREPWLAIDPKPLVGEREFDAASLLRDRRWLLREPDAGRRIRRRLDLLVAELGLDRERMRGWGVAHALVWGISGDKHEPDMIECARLLLLA
jgi:streptomycin 6-kinase